MKVRKTKAERRIEANTIRVEIRLINGKEVPCRVLAPHGDYSCNGGFGSRHIPKTGSRLDQLWEVPIED